ncbi:MAG: hypothetical protein GTO49_25785, partial [Anaerolineae bacterium]|nr:hypothetical protein [Anaerolineae bacterium]
MTTELAERLGLLAEYNEAINHGGFLGIALKGTPYELEPNRKYTREELHERFCRVASLRLTKGQAEYGLDWFREHGALVVPFPK